MFEQLKQTFDKVMELAFTTKDKIQQSVTEIARENNLTKEEAKKLLDQLIKKSEEVKKNLEVRITDIQKTAIEKMNLVSKDELTKLEERIKVLEKQAKGKSGSKAASKVPVRTIRKNR